MALPDVWVKPTSSARNILIPRVNGRAVASAGDGVVSCVEIDVGIEEPHVGSFEGT